MAIKIIDKKEAAGLTSGISELFVRIPNPSYVYPPFEVCPIAAPLTGFDKPPVAAVMDMDGTTTTTETLCLHSLVHAVRKAMGPGGTDWPGLDPQRDYPNVIGNSTTKHVEYLVDAYGARFHAPALAEAFLNAAEWTLRHSRDEQRRRQVQINLRQLEAESFGADDNTLSANSNNPDNDASHPGSPGGGISLAGTQMESLVRKLERRDFQIQACIDIYYQRYHEILAAIEAGDRDFLSNIPGVDADRPLIEPMPGVAVTLALLSGDLGEEAGVLAGLLSTPDAGESMPAGRDEATPGDAAGDAAQEQSIPDPQETLARLGRFFRNHPVRLALVTSSIRYEAEVVMSEVFHILRQETASWPVSEEVRQRLKHRFSSPDACYDAFVTATDSSEIRLKPFRDLYSIALQQAGVAPEDFDAVIGFEDSQSGTVAIRAAGIGRCVAVPFHETGGHDFNAASVVAYGGLPEVLLHHRFFLDKFLEEPA